jgi:UDP-N-acetyl-D-mannosaminuronic acid dehydrogenase
MASEKVVVVGLGYVGLPAALMLAKAGYQVRGVDTKPEVVSKVNEHVCTIPGEGFEAITRDPEVVRNLSATTEMESGDIIIIAVPTPLRENARVADLSFVDAAVETVAGHLKPGNLVILESTVPPLTCRKHVASRITEITGLRCPDDVMVAHCPERILPGRILHEIVHNDRIIGGMDKESAEAARRVYASFVKGQLRVTDDVTAELCKLLENTHRYVNIALANEMRNVAESIGVDWREAFELVNCHPRVSYLTPGIGVGGHCIPLDPWFIRECVPDNVEVVEAAGRVNDAQPAKVAAAIRRACASVKSPVVVAVGASYKPDTDDMRESPAIHVVDLLRQDGYDVRHYDPMVPGMGYTSLADAAKGADLLVVLVNHSVVREELSGKRAAIENVMNRPMVMEY